METDDAALKKLSLHFFMVEGHLEQFKKLEGEYDVLQHNVPQDCRLSGRRVG